MIKKFIQKLFSLRTDVGLNFYTSHFFYRHILHQNKKVKWAIHHTSTVLVPENIVRGKNVYPGDSPGNYIQAYNGIFIGDYTNLGPNVGLISADHDLIDNTKHIKADPIKIGKFCWVGMNAIVLPSVILGDFTIVGAGAVVTKSFPDGYCVVAGNPATVIKYLDKEKCEQYRSSKL